MIENGIRGHWIHFALKNIILTIQNCNFNKKFMIRLWWWKTVKNQNNKTSSLLLMIPLVFISCILSQSHFYPWNDISLYYIKTPKYIYSLNKNILNFGGMLAQERAMIPLVVFLNPNTWNINQVYNEYNYINEMQETNKMKCVEYTLVLW